ncbi:Alpha/Beta hydrolase protein [Aspergillus filifer]
MRTGGIVKGGRKRVVIAYFQGNGGSTPLRLPLLSQTLRAIHDHATSTFNTNHTSPTDSTANGSTGSETETEYILLALSYRGYWKSKGRATQKGIQKDAQAFLNWIAETYAESNTELNVVLWGHSLGAAVASDALVRRLSNPALTSTATIAGLEEQGTAGRLMKLSMKGIVLEAPISSIKDMLISLYPQKWLPYRYLWPFSWNNWDVKSSLEQLALHKSSSSTPAHLQIQDDVPPILVLSAESDEVIPTWVADDLESKAKSVGLEIQRKDVKGAMHIECPLKYEGRKALVEFIVGSSSSSAPDADAGSQGRA